MTPSRSPCPSRLTAPAGPGPSRPFARTWPGLTTALSFGASFGLASLAWRYLLGFKGTEAQLPLYIFIFLVVLPSVLVAEVGVAVVIGVLVDTLVVRTVLVDALEAPSPRGACAALPSAAPVTERW
jgi:uncharacterized membrane protein YdfJ with MMPL/SSD domain